MKLNRVGYIAVAMLAVAVTWVQAEEWGTLKGKFVLKGDAPKLDPLKINKDVEFCGAELPDPKVKVGEGNALQNVAIWLYVGRGTDDPAIHPDYSEAMKKEAFVGNKDCLYSPHISIAMAGQPIKFENLDPIAHNFKVEGFSNGSINNLVPPGGSFVHTFDDGERTPMGASCSIHGWMNSYLIVRDNPYVAVAGKDGTFEIKNVPVGEHEFQVWHEASGYVKEFVVNGEENKDRKGLIELEVKPGDNDLGVLTIDAELLE